MSGTMKTIDQAAVAFEEGSFTAANTTAAKLVATSKSCKRVFLFAPVDGDGVEQNTKPVFFGDATNQHDWIAVDGSRDREIHIDDPSKIYVKLGAVNEVLRYRIEY